jgi:hypothetical protein
MALLKAFKSPFKGLYRHFKGFLKTFRAFVRPFKGSFKAKLSKALNMPF